MPIKSTSRSPEKLDNKPTLPPPLNIHLNPLTCHWATLPQGIRNSPRLLRLKDLTNNMSFLFITHILKEL